jgi:hypothetical protein
VRLKISAFSPFPDEMQRFPLSAWLATKRRGSYLLHEHGYELIEPSASTAWALHALSQNQEVQSRLRAELFSISTDNPTMDELNAFPYLESVVRDSLS